MTEQIYDVAIVGSGPAGLWAAMELVGSGNIVLLEAVKRLHDTRNVSNGFMGGSAKSDVRLFIEPGFGGVVDDPEVIEYFLAHLQSHNDNSFKILNNTLPNKFVEWFNENNVQIDEPATIIISADKMAAIETNIQKHLEDNIVFKPNCEIIHIKKSKKYFELITTNSVILAKTCILALGRGGAHWLKENNETMQLEFDNSKFDLGVRLEFPHSVVKKYTDKSPSFRIKWDNYKTTAFSIKGNIEMENVFDIKTSNGRTINNRQTCYSNIGLLKTFENPDALEKVLNLVQISNILADGQLIKESVKKILNDRSILSPIDEFASLKDGIKKMLDLFPGILDNGYLYAPEARLNALRLKLSKNMETSIKGLYVVGDMSGLTNSFVQAACTGLIAAQHIVSKLK